MNASNYLKLIEFSYILEGFQILYEFESDKSANGEMFLTASAIIDEIFKYSWFDKTISSHTKSILSQQWRKIICGKQSLDYNLFKNVLSDIHNVCEDYLLKKYSSEKYASGKFASEKYSIEYSKIDDFKKSSLTIDSGVQTLVEQPQMQSGGSKQSLDFEKTQKKEKKSSLDKFANIPKELLEKNGKLQTNVLEKHINKTFSFYQRSGIDSNSSSAQSTGPLKHLNPSPTEDDPILPILQYKLKKISLNSREN
uniref:Uncharacterized protein n=1 Tax=Tetranychus urticae TaxID=32264 RepID=T1KET3_TETUR